MNAQEIAELGQRVLDNVDRVIIGKRQVTELVLVAMLAEGHVLLEDVPGVGKTMLARSVARSIGGEFKRIQFTPDLLPSDVSGLSYFNQKLGDFEFRPGPVFTNILLADEINRATPRTQSSLLEAMQERTVTIEGDTMRLPAPFLVLATENPVELEGTFPLPEAQLDRFLVRLPMGYPSEEEEAEMLGRFQTSDPLDTLEPVTDAATLTEASRSIRDVHVDEEIRQYLTKIVRGTREHDAVELGVSPRGTLALFRAAQALAALRGREFCEPDDVKALARSVLSHRIMLSPEARLRGRTVEHIISEVVGRVEAPVEPWQPEPAMASALERLSASRSTFFSHAWIYGGIAIVLLGMALRERAVTLLGIVPLVTAGGSWLWARYSLTNVEYARELSETRVFAGDQVKLHIRVTNRKLLPLASLDIEDTVADRLRVVERDLVPSGTPGTAILQVTTAMRWFERVTWNLTVECPARGYFPIGPVSLRSSDAFGFFQQREQIPGVDHITVFPAIANLDRILVPARHLFGEQKIQRPIITDPMRTIGIRDYRPEDSFRHIHWKATARAQSLQTKIFEPTTSIQFGIFLNLDTFERYWEGLDFDRAEGAIVTAATIASHAVEANHMVGLYANGVVGGSDQALRVRPSRDDRQFELMLSGLAKLSPIASLDYAAIVRAETSRFPIGSTVVLVTAIMTDRLRIVLDGLIRANHRVVVVTVGEVDIPRHARIEIYPVDQEALAAYIPEHHHYAVRMSNMPTPPPLDQVTEALHGR